MHDGEKQIKCETRDATHTISSVNNITVKHDVYDTRVFIFFNEFTLCNVFANQILLLIRRRMQLLLASVDEQIKKACDRFV